MPCAPASSSTGWGCWLLCAASQSICAAWPMPCHSPRREHASSPRASATPGSRARGPRQPRRRKRVALAVWGRSSLRPPAAGQIVWRCGQPRPLPCWLLRLHGRPQSGGWQGGRQAGQGGGYKIIGGRGGHHYKFSQRACDSDTGARDINLVLFVTGQRPRWPSDFELHEARFLHHHGGAVFQLAGRQCLVRYRGRTSAQRGGARVAASGFGAHVRPVLRGAGPFCRGVCRCHAQRAGHADQQHHQGAGLPADAVGGASAAGLLHGGPGGGGVFPGQVRHPDRVAAFLPTGAGQWLD